jgi:proline iminopeptidase
MIEFDGPQADPLAPGVHAIEVDGLRQVYHVAGSGPVCVAHSGGPGIAWDYLRAPELEDGMTMVYVAPIGAGESDRLATHPEGYSVARYAAMLEGLIAHLNVPRVLLLGHSHGGFVAQRYAIDHPERLAGLVLYDSAPSAGRELMAEASRNIEAFAARHPGSSAAQDVLAAWRDADAVSDDAGFTDTLDRLFPAYFADYWGRAADFASLRLRWRATHVVAGGPAFDLHARLVEIAVPTLVLAGRHDFICGVRWAKALYGGIVDSELLVFEDSGHFAHLEQPEAFAEAIFAFAGRRAV